MAAVPVWEIFAIMKVRNAEGLKEGIVNGLLIVELFITCKTEISDL